MTDAAIMRRPSDKSYWVVWVFARSMKSTRCQLEKSHTVTRQAQGSVSKTAFW
jgi:hypothetical protein